MKGTWKNKVIIFLAFMILIVSFAFCDYTCSQIISFNQYSNCLEMNETYVDSLSLDGTIRCIHDLQYGNFMYEEGSKSRFGSYQKNSLAFVYIAAFIFEIVFRTFIFPFVQNLVKVWSVIIYIHSVDGKKGRLIFEF